MEVRLPRYRDRIGVRLTCFRLTDKRFAGIYVGQGERKIMTKTKTTTKRRLRGSTEQAQFSKR